MPERKPHQLPPPQIHAAEGAARGRGWYTAGEALSGLGAARPATPHSYLLISSKEPEACVLGNKVSPEQSRAPCPCLPSQHCALGHAGWARIWPKPRPSCVARQLTEFRVVSVP